MEAAEGAIWRCFPCSDKGKAFLKAIESRNTIIIPMPPSEPETWHLATWPRPPKESRFCPVDGAALSFDAGHDWKCSTCGGVFTWVSDKS